MTTTRPRPPSISSSVEGEPLIPLHHSEALYYIVGPPGAGATLSGGINERPTAVFTALDATLEGLIGTDGITHTAVEAIFDQVDTNVVVKIVPSDPSHQQSIDGLEQIRYVSGSVPTHLYAPGQTALGSVLGTIVGTLAAGADTLTLAAAALMNVEVDELLRIQDEIVRVTAVASQTSFTIERAQHGTADVAHITSSVSDILSPVATELRQLVDEYECVAVADAPRNSILAAIAWADAGNVGENVMGVFNRADNNWPGGFWLGAAAAVAARYTRARGIQQAKVGGVTSLEYELTHSPRATVTTDVSNLVGAYLSTLVRRRGRVEIVGDTFKGPVDARKKWSVALVVNHLRRLLEESAESFIGPAGRHSTVVRLASHVQRAGRQLVGDGEEAELNFLSVVPHPVDNTADARANGLAALNAIVETVSPIERIEIPITLRIGA